MTYFEYIYIPVLYPLSVCQIFVIMCSIVIRRLEGDSLKYLATLFKKIFTDCFSSHPVFEDAVRGEIVYAAFINDEVAGFVSVWQEDSFIHFLAVDEKYRMMGIGRKLLGMWKKHSAVPYP